MIIVRENTRAVEVPEEDYIFGVESDQYAVAKTIRIPRYTDKNRVVVPGQTSRMDLSTFKISIKYRNAKGETDEYAPYANEITTGTDYIDIDWRLSRHVTSYKGDIQFSVCCKKLNADNVTIDYEWNSGIGIGKCLDGIEVFEGYVQDVTYDILQRINTSLGHTGLHRWVKDVAYSSYDFDTNFDVILAYPAKNDTITISYSEAFPAETFTEPTIIPMWNSSTISVSYSNPNSLVLVSSRNNVEVLKFLIDMVYGVSERLAEYDSYGSAEGGSF